MNMAEYQQYCRHSLLSNAAPLPEAELIRLVAGLCSEAGEVAGLQARLLQGREVPNDHWLEELGDVLWYLTALAQKLGYTLEDLAKYNHIKLIRRFASCQDKSTQTTG